MCRADQLTGFYMKATRALNGLNTLNVLAKDPSGMPDCVQNVPASGDNTEYKIHAEI